MAQFQLNESLIILTVPDKFPIPHPQVTGLPTLSAIVIGNVALQFMLVSKSSELPISTLLPQRVTPMFRRFPFPVLFPFYSTPETLPLCPFVSQQNPSYAWPLS